MHSQFFSLRTREIEKREPLFCSALFVNRQLYSLPLAADTMHRSLCSVHSSSGGVAARRRAAGERQIGSATMALQLPRRHRSSRLVPASSSFHDSSDESALLNESRDLLRRFWKVIGGAQERETEAVKKKKGRARLREKQGGNSTKKKKLDWKKKKKKKKKSKKNAAPSFSFSTVPPPSLSQTFSTLHPLSPPKLGKDPERARRGYVLCSAVGRLRQGRGPKEV